MKPGGVGAISCPGVRERPFGGGTLEVTGRAIGATGLSPCGGPEMGQTGQTGRAGVYRRVIPWGVLVLWVIALAVAGSFAGKLADVQRDRTADYLPSGADSTQVARLQEELPGGEVTGVLLVYHRDGGLTAADRGAAERQVAEVTVPAGTTDTVAAKPPCSSPGGRIPGTSARSSADPAFRPGTAPLSCTRCPRPRPARTTRRRRPSSRVYGPMRAVPTG